MGEVIHFAGNDVQVNHLLRQRCAWCGFVLIDFDLNRVAVPVGQDPRPATWPVSSLVAVDGNASWVVEHDAVNPLPENTCVGRAGEPDSDQLLVDLEARFKESLGKPAVLLPAGSKREEFVLTWYPVDGEPTEVPFGIHVVCPEEVGEFRLSTREVSHCGECADVRTFGDTESVLLCTKPEGECDRAPAVESPEVPGA